MIPKFREFRFLLPVEMSAPDNVLVKEEKEAPKTGASRYYQPEVDSMSPCEMCPVGRECVPCSRIVPSYNKDYRKAALDLRKWWAEHVKRIKQPENELMRKGKEAHERLDKECRVTRDLNEVFAALNEVGKPVRWSARLCSRLDGIRGQPDMIESTRVTPDKVYHKITEWKSHPSPHRKYFPQACAYALLLAYPRMIANGLYFYDHVDPTRSFSVNIDFCFEYYESGTPRSYQFVRDGKFITTREADPGQMGAEYVFGVKRLIKKFSGLTRVKNISDIKRCGYCPSVDSQTSTINGGNTPPDALCHVWQLCRTDLLLNNKLRQKKLGRWVRKPANRVTDSRKSATITTR